MFNYQNSIKSKEDTKRAGITLGFSRKNHQHQQMLKLQGTLRGASDGHIVIESQCRIGSPVPS